MSSNENQELRIGELEAQLEKYNRQLKASLEHDRQFQLKATWNILNTVMGVGAFVGALWLAERLGLTGWISGAIFGGFAVLGAWLVSAATSRVGRKSDLARLSDLPTWESRSK